jgi:hypothetical protein
MEEADLLVEGELFENEVGALFGREQFVHPGTILGLILLVLGISVLGKCWKCEYREGKYGQG